MKYLEINLIKYFKIYTMASAKPYKNKILIKENIPCSWIGRVNTVISFFQIVLRIQSNSSKNLNMLFLGGNW